jgi:hypothetical protein
MIGSAQSLPGVVSKSLVYALVQEKAHSVAGEQGFPRFFQSLQGLLPGDGGESVQKALPIENGSVDRRTPERLGRVQAAKTSTEYDNAERSADSLMVTQGANRKTVREAYSGRSGATLQALRAAYPN